ncbi:LacI family DNA-binding transcriptional regulator [Novosphingobium sp. PhB165]|uniref:LacI family DNA-binding transcriptional regulator n=1 Tax=Novosphingobium sp. PhB165 TaxID=2485105 RepID=UPI001FB2BACF|nr:LacI family DNA-binding transcriptional regulator [Novosphingobium sp. PhB165]
MTIQSVAERAGVSTMTVSNVFNRTGKVGAETRARVMAVIEELGYVPNLAARRLTGSAVARLGLIHADRDSMFINAMIAAVSIAAAEKGLQLIIRAAKVSSPAATIALANGLVRSGAQALLLIPPFAESMAESAASPSLGVPVAAISTASALADITTVRIDNHAAAHAVTSHLVAGGRRRIAVVTGPANHSDSVARLEGHIDALRDHGLSFAPALCISGDFTFLSGLEAAEKLLALPGRPDAIVTANDDMAAGVLWQAHRQGVRVPAELAVTGFDDTLIATRVWPLLTTVHQPILEMAAQALDLVVQAARDPETYGAARDVVLPFKVIERGSS